MLNADQPVVVRFAGDLGIGRHDEIRAAFADSTPGTGPILIDLAEVTSMDSVFLSELLLFRRKAAHRRMVTLVKSSEVLRVFTITGLTERLELFGDAHTAYEAVGLTSPYGGDPDGIQAAAEAEEALPEA